jgi:hypothetical protein
MNCVGHRETQGKIKRCHGTMVLVNLLTEAFGDMNLDMTNHEAPGSSEVNYMIEEFCYTRCPHVDCQAVFYDYDGCDAVMCEACGTTFCSICGFTAPPPPSRMVDDENSWEDNEEYWDDNDEYWDDNDDGVHNHMASHEDLAYDEHDEQAHFRRHHQQRRFKQVASYIRRMNVSDSEKRGMATLMSRWVEFAEAEETLEEAVLPHFWMDEE